MTDTTTTRGADTATTGTTVGRDERVTPTDGAVHRLTTCTTLLGAVLLVAVAAHPGMRDGSWTVPIVLGLLLAERTASRRRVGRDGWSWSASDALLTAGLVLAPGLLLPVGAVLAMLAGDLRRVEGRKLRFNAAQELAAASTAVLVTLGCNPALGPIGAAAAGTIAYFATNTALVLAVLTVSSGAPVRQLVDTHLPSVLRSWSASSALGLAAAALVDRPLVAVLLVLPLVVTNLEHRAEVRRADRERALRRLHELVALGDRTESGALRAVCTVATDVLTCASARIVTGDDLGVVSFDGAGRGGAVVLDDVDDLALLTRLAAGGGAPRFEDDRYRLVVHLPDPTAGRTTALVVDAARPGVPFAAGDVELARTIAVAGGAVIEAARRGERERIATQALHDLAAPDTSRPAGVDQVGIAALAELRAL
ncbi:MAG: hypothetical protein ACLGIR_11475 [Actinomycetes bacterium]